MAINTVQDLQTALQEAIQVELTTIPAYLYATYSMTGEPTQANDYIFGVAVEEMLHMALAANILIAVGGQPKFYDPDIVPTYPCLLPHHAIVTPGLIVPSFGKALPVILAKCDLPNLQIFLEIEQPQTAYAQPESDSYDTIGQFYNAIKEAFANLTLAGVDLFGNNVPGKQLTGTDAYTAGPDDSDDSGGLVLVTNVTSAQLAMQYIVQQGEGIQQEQYDDPLKTEFSHYYKFLQIQQDPSLIGSVQNLVTNPKASDFSGSLEKLANLSNAAYSYLLLLIENIYATDSNVDQTTKDNLISGLADIMRNVITPIASVLILQPVAPDSGQYAGPPFQYYDYLADASHTPKQQLQSLYAEVTGSYPDLDTLDVGTIIDGLPDVSLAQRES